MELLRGSASLGATRPPCAATIGNFDGLHRGHTAVIGAMVDQAAAHGLGACVITFEPLPHEFFRAAQAPPRLMRFREKYQHLSRCGVDTLLVLNFNARLAALEAESFVRQILVDGLRLRHLTVGDDFRFGRGRQGDMALLRKLGARHGFEVSPTASCLGDDGQRVSSTRIRELLAAARFAEAARLLGRPFSITGRVGYGQQLARGLGYATANIDLGRVQPPLRGVFAVSAARAGHPALPGVANLGTRPTVHGLRLVFEVHLFDFDEDLYGQRLCVSFRHKLREERRFDSLDALRAQIGDDCRRAREYFAASADA